MVFEVKDLSYSIEGKFIVKGLNLNVLCGDKFVFIGFNGSGKSMFIKFLLGEF